MQQYTDFQYHNNPQVYGYYQYTSLEELVDNFMLSINDDDYHVNTPKERILLQFMRGFRTIYTDIANEIKAVQLTLSDDLAVVLPQDFVQLVRLSWVDETGKLHLIAIDRRLNIAKSYLQDQNYNLLFDSNGNILMGSGERPQIDDAEINRFEFYMPQADLSEVYFNGRYNIDKENGFIYFSSDLAFKNIVLEYISDGLYFGDNNTTIADLKIHKFCEPAINNFVYYELIKNRRNVPAYEKQRARKEYFVELKNARMKLNALRYIDLIQVFKKGNALMKQ